MQQACPSFLAWRTRKAPDRPALWQRQRDAPDLLQKEAAEPGGVVPDTQGVSTFANELHAHRIGGRIDLRERYVDRRDPDEAVSHRNVAALPGDAGLDGGDDAVRLRIDAGHRSVALIERP